MSLVAEFSLRSSDLVLAPALETAPDVTVELEHQMATDLDRPAFVFWAFGGDFERWETGLERDVTVREWTVIEDLADRKLYWAQIDRDEITSIYPIYQQLGAAPMAATGTAEGWQRRVRFPGRESIVEMRQYCADNGVEFTLHRLYTSGESELEDEFGLSSEQRRALVTAQREGYFDVPRRMSLDELGEKLDITGQSTSERLRRGVSTLISNTLLSDL
ncbi:bacterio-opsin activator [Halobacteriales archaeon QS_1_67_19]|nr:MAG: bacterio-opsin activator [Halobacteriales archaeon QS_1_67_19]